VSDDKTISQLDKQHVWHPFTQMKEWMAGEPLVISSAEGNYLIDDSGRRYLDGVASLWVNVHGHGREEINAAIRSQLDQVAHTTLLGLTTPPAALLAKQLADLAPVDLSRVFYSDSGSTAVEIALKQAFQYWQHRGCENKRRFINLEASYHGDTLGAVAVGGIPIFHEVFAPLLPTGNQAALEVPSPGVRGHSKEYALAGLEEVLESHGEEVAAFIFEPLVQGAGGMLMQPIGYLAEAAALCRKHQVLLIADEVATGFGRTGTMFACEQESVCPDLMCLAKGMTGGYLPLAATLATEEVFSAFLGERSDYRTFFHGHTYTGNALACAAALASLQLFESDAVLAGVTEKAWHLAQLFKQRLAGSAYVVDIRQRGLMCGIELGNRSGESFPAEEAVGARVCDAARSHGVVLRPLGDVIVLMPPLSITNDELETLVDALGLSIADVLE
jgi:adenosylmethionine-8-amino-7-oxononanoate aminotransferase